MQKPLHYSPDIKKYLSEDESDKFKLSSPNSDGDNDDQSDDFQAIEIIGSAKTQSPLRKSRQEKTYFTDFSFKKIIGRGAFGKVALVEKKNSGKLYAMKIISKDVVNQNNQIAYIKQEKQIMQNVNCPFIVQLHYAF